MWLVVYYWCRRLLIEHRPPLEWDDNFGQDPERVTFRGVSPQCLERERFVNVVKWHASSKLKEHPRLLAYLTPGLKWGRTSYEIDYRTDEWEEDVGLVPFDQDCLTNNPPIAVRRRREGEEQEAEEEVDVAVLFVRVTLRLMRSVLEPPQALLSKEE